MAETPAQIVASVKADVAKVEAVVKTTWTQKVLPWLTHIGAAAAGYFTANPGGIASILKFLWKLVP